MGKLYNDDDDDPEFKTRNLSRDTRDQRIECGFHGNRNPGGHLRVLPVQVVEVEKGHEGRGSGREESNDERLGELPGLDRSLEGRKCSHRFLVGEVAYGKSGAFSLQM